MQSAPAGMHKCSPQSSRHGPPRRAKTFPLKRRLPTLLFLGALLLVWLVTVLQVARETEEDGERIHDEGQPGRAHADASAPHTARDAEGNAYGEARTGQGPRESSPTESVVLIGTGDVDKTSEMGWPAPAVSAHLPLPVGVQPWSDAARQYLSFTQADDDALPILHRPGEQPVSHRQFLQCLADRLNVDVATRTQRPLLDPESTTPLIVFPMMMELADIRALMCNMTNHIRYVMYVDNGGLEVVGRFLADVGNAFGWTGRVAVRRYPHNVGCAGAINNGIHWALQLPHEEVPFIHISNSDVRFPPGLYETRIRDMHKAVAHDITRIRELEAEVAKEDADPATWAHYKSGRALRGEWSPNATLVTSKLLPDRIRYMPLTERIKQFNNHTGMMFFHKRKDASTYLLSRLAALTVGYNDENFFPAYFEDIDYIWRAELLGLRLAAVPADGTEAIHFVNALIKLSHRKEVATSQPSLPDTISHTHGAAAAEAAFGRPEPGRALAPEVVRHMNMFAKSMSDRATYHYAIFKWNTMEGASAAGEERRAEPFSPSSQWRTAEEARQLYAERALLHWERLRATRTGVRRGGSLADGFAIMEALRDVPIERDVRRIPEAALVRNDARYPPLDAWVRDEHFQSSIRAFMRSGILGSGAKREGEGGENGSPPRRYASYNPDLVSSLLQPSPRGRSATT